MLERPFSELFSANQFVIFKPCSYCFVETIWFDLKASFASRSVSRLISWYNKPGDIIKELWEKVIQFHGTFHGLKITNCNVSLWNQYKYIVFNIFTYRILIISYKITGISNEKINALTIYKILCQNFTIFYRQGLIFFISSAIKIETVQEFKIKPFE